MKQFLLVILLTIYNIGYSQLNVTPYSGSNLQQFVQNNLIGSGITISNVTYYGVSSQMGAFDASNTIINTNYGMNSGIVLTPGLASNAESPNNVPWVAGAGAYTGDFNDDSDLHSLIGDAAINKCILEFDFVPTGDSIKFEYIFGSDEYPEFVNQYNDGFGFFLSGSGINGSFSNNAVNLAVIPNTSTPVTIDNVNATTNSSYYVYNGDPGNATVESPYNTDNQYIEYDGYTVALTAKAKVDCGQTYHIKLAIADARDQSYDSGVLINGSSFSSISLATEDQNIVNCPGNLITLSASVSGGTPGYSYLWNTNETTPSIDVSSTGTYSVDITDACGVVITQQFNIGCNLGVRLTDFEVVKEGNDVQVEWETVNENSSDYFVVEYMSDKNKIWIEKGIVESNINSSEVNKYLFIDQKTEIGYNYYRLKQVDLDGKITYYDPKSVLFEQKTYNFYPQPAQSLLNVDLLHEQERVYLYNIQGQIVKTNILYDSKKAIINVESIESGVYYIKVFLKEKLNKTIKIVIE